MDNYPIGAENDPRAPWNQEEPEPKTVDVTVSITLSKTFTIKISDYKVIDSGKDEDNEYFEDIDCTTADLKQYVKNQVYLPNEAVGYIDKNYPRVKRDLDNWNVDDFEVILE